MVYFKALSINCLDGLIEKTKLHLRQSISIMIRTGYLPITSHKLYLPGIYLCFESEYTHVKRNALSTMKVAVTILFSRFW
jgi:hypothetical protein